MGIKLKLNGKPFVPNDLLPVSEKIRRFLESKPDEVFDSVTLEETLKVPSGTIRDCVKRIPDHNELIARIRYWGVPAARAELRRMMGI